MELTEPVSPVLPGDWKFWGSYGNCPLAKDARFPPGTKKAPAKASAISVAADVLLSNQFMEDLDRIWALRPWIPDPKDPSTWK